MLHNVVYCYFHIVFKINENPCIYAEALCFVALPTVLPSDSVGAFLS